MSRGVSDRARRRAALAFLTVACLAPLPAARGAVHAYGHDAFGRVGDAFLFYAGREGMLRGTTTRATTGETLRGVNDGRSYVQLNDVMVVRAEEAASHHAGGAVDAVTGAVEAIFFEAGDASRVGYGDADGERALCCDAAAVTRLGCVYGRAFVDDASNNANNASVWTAEALFYGASREARFAPKAGDGMHAGDGDAIAARVASFDVASDGMYELLFVSCDETLRFDETLLGSDVSLKQEKQEKQEPPEPPSLPYYSVAGRSVWKNPDGYLPGRARHDRAVYAAAAASYAALAAAWTFAVASKIAVRDAIQPVHVAVFVILALGMAEYLARYANAAQFNEKGTKPVAGVFAAATLSAAREAASRACVLLASLGLGITRLSLGDAVAFKTKTLTGAYFACSLVLELDTQRVLVASDAGAWRVGAAADAHDDVEQSARELVALPVAALDAAFAVLVLSALTKTLAKLEARRQHAKLALYRQFTEAIALLVVVSVAWQAFSTFLAVADGAEGLRTFAERAPFWRWEWTARAGWIAIEVGVTAATCVLWRPSSAPERYAYRELEDRSSGFATGKDADVGSNEARRSDAARGARKPKTKKTSSQKFRGLMAGTPTRGVALEQTPMRRGGLDDTSSDEEAKME